MKSIAIQPNLIGVKLNSRRFFFLFISDLMDKLNVGVYTSIKIRRSASSTDYFFNMRHNIIVPWQF